MFQPNKYKAATGLSIYIYCKLPHNFHLHTIYHLPFLSGLSVILIFAFLNKHTCYFSLNFNSKGKTLITFKLYYQKRNLPCPLQLWRVCKTNDHYKIWRQILMDLLFPWNLYEDLSGPWDTKVSINFSAFDVQFKETEKDLKHFRLLFFYFNLFEKISYHLASICVDNQYCIKVGWLHPSQLRLPALNRRTSKESSCSPKYI